MRYYPTFRLAIPHFKVDSYVLLTRLPLPLRAVRLACLRHTASVHPEPGSNSQKKCLIAHLHFNLLKIFMSKKLTDCTIALL